MSFLGFLRRKPATPLRLKISVVVEPDDNGTFHAFCPAFKGLHVDGASEDEAVMHAEDALLVYLASLQRHRDPLPVGPDCTVERDTTYHVPAGAFLHHLELQWPSQGMSGIS